MEPAVAGAEYEGLAPALGRALGADPAGEKPEADLGATVEGVERPAGAIGVAAAPPVPRPGFPEGVTPVVPGRPVAKLFPGLTPAGPPRGAAPGPENVLGAVLQVGAWAGVPARRCWGTTDR